MTIQTLARTDSLEQLAACEDYNRFVAEQEELTRHHMELKAGMSLTPQLTLTTHSQINSHTKKLCTKPLTSSSHLTQEAQPMGSLSPSHRSKLSSLLRPKLGTAFAVGTRRTSTVLLSVAMSPLWSRLMVAWFTST